MLSSYQRRVSFDSLSQNREFDVDDPLHIPPQYTNADGSTSNKRNRELDLNFGFDTLSRNTDVLEIFNSFNEIGNRSALPSVASSSPYTHSYKKKKKIPKLPPPPKKSILKGNYNYLNSNDDPLQPVPSLLRTLPPAGRKKSIVEMTTEELIAMDQQFRTGVDLGSLKFDGDGYLPFQNSTSELYSKKSTSYTGSRMIKNIDKGSIYNKKSAVHKDITNLNSYSASFKHKNMDQFLKQHYNIQDEEQNSNDVETKKDKYIDNTKIVPESLRNVMIYISGRKHTWNAIDYCLKNYLQDGDQLIIICHIPTLPTKKKNNTYNYNYYTEDDELCEQAKNSIENLSFYVFRLIELLNKQDLKISIRIEFIKHFFIKNVLKDSVRFYKPQIFLVSSLLSTLNLTFAKRYMKLPVYIMENLNIPTLVIPTLLIHEEEEDDHKKDGEGDTAIDDDDDGEIVHDQDTFFNKLDNIMQSIDPDKDFDSSLRKIRSRPSVIRASISSQGSNYNPTNYEFTDNSEISPFQPTSPRIKFSDHLEVPRNPSVGGGSSSSRRGSSAYRVKSLLDEDYDDVKIIRSKSNSTNPVTPSTSNNEIKRRLSAQSASSTGTTKTSSSSKKSGFFSGLFKKKK